jgi:hypothetical protein
MRSRFHRKRNGLNRETEVHGGPEILNERNRLRVLKNSRPEKCPEKLCVRKPNKRRSRLG